MRWGAFLLVLCCASFACVARAQVPEEVHEILTVAPAPGPEDAADAWAIRAEYLYWYLRRLEVPPLSAPAVTELAARHGVDGEALYRETNGNPFFVNEVLAAGTEEIPHTVRDAVLARTAHLTAPARSLVEAVAIVPTQAEVWLLEAVADGPVDERRGDRRVDAPGQAADHPLRPDLRPDLLDGGVDDREVGPRRPAPRQLVQEVLDDRLPVRRVRDLRVVLHAVDAALTVLERRHRCLRCARGGHEPRRHPRDGVEVRHPDGLLVGAPHDERRQSSVRKVASSHPGSAGRSGR